MLGFLGALGFAAGIILTATGFGAPIGIPLKIASAVAIKTGAVAIGASLGISFLGFSVFKSSKETNVKKEVTSFYDAMQKSAAQSMNPETDLEQ
jgi:hypothetical protein